MLLAITISVFRDMAMLLVLLSPADSESR